MVPTKTIAVVLIALMCTGLSGYFLQSEHRTVDRTTYDYLGDTTSSVQYSVIEDYAEYNPPKNVTGWTGVDLPTTERVTPYVKVSADVHYVEIHIDSIPATSSSPLATPLASFDLSSALNHDGSIIRGSEVLGALPFYHYNGSAYIPIYSEFDTHVPIRYLYYQSADNKLYEATYSTSTDSEGNIIRNFEKVGTIGYTLGTTTDSQYNVFITRVYDYLISGNLYYPGPIIWSRISSPAEYINNQVFVEVPQGVTAVWGNDQTNGIVNVLMSKNTEIVKDEPAYYFMFDFNNHIVYDSRGNTIRMELQEVGHAPGWYKFTDDDGVEWRTVWTGYSPGGAESLVRMENPDGVQINFGCPLTGTPTLSNPIFSDGQDRDVYYLYAYRYPSGMAYDLRINDSLGNTFYPTNMHPGTIESPTWYEFTDAKGNHWITISAGNVGTGTDTVRYTIKSETTGQEVTFQVTRGDVSNSFFVYEDWTQHAKISVPSSLPYDYYLATLDFRNGIFTCRGVEGWGNPENPSTQAYLLASYVYNLDVNGDWSTTVTGLNIKAATGTGPAKVFIDSTFVAIDPEGRLWGNPYVALDYFYPQQTEYSVRLLFNAFVSLGDSITINGQTFPVSEGKILITDSENKTTPYPLKGMAVDFVHKPTGGTEVRLVFTELRNTVVNLGDLQTTNVTNPSVQFGDITSKIGYLISMTGAWYWQSGLYDIKVTSAEEVGLDLDSGIFGLSGSAACLLMIGFMLLFTAILMYGLKYEMGPYDWLVLIVSTVLLLTLAATW